MLAKKLLLIIFLIEFSCVMGFSAVDDPDIDAIEAELTKKKDESKSESAGAKEANAQQGAEVEKTSEEEAVPDQLEFKDLSKLVPFSEISVIQKKFLPKKFRFQFHLGMERLSNNPFYDSAGVASRLAFYFSESIGIEASAMTLSRKPKYVTEDLKETHEVLTTSIVSAKSYYGLDLVLIPFYGKITWLNERIIPYDFYISFGGGTTELNDIKEAAPTMHVAFGQIYALTKNIVIRWDLTGNSYQANVPEVSNTGGSSTNKHIQKFNDIFVGGGISFLFPGAGYR
jgi:outer membrane beta-barrel protein